MTQQQQSSSVSVNAEQSISADEAQGEQADRRVKILDVLALPEFKLNPLAGRLCMFFSKEQPGRLSFDEFVDLYHVLSPKASKQVKIEVAFRVYDFDGDDYIGEEDLQKLVRLTTTRDVALYRSLAAGGGADVELSGDKDLLNDENMRDIIDHVMKACDLDGRGRLSFHEFERVMNLQGEDFENKFCVAIDY